MTEVHDFIIAHGSRMIGIAGTACITGFLIWKLKGPLVPAVEKAFVNARPFGAGVILVAVSLLLAQPPNAFDWLTFKDIRVGTGMLGAGYALMIFAMYRLLRRGQEPR